ncbi:MAG: hypothetical protein EON93_22615, partial [Burkholderiales bacterium]
MAAIRFRHYRETRGIDRVSTDGAMRDTRLLHPEQGDIDSPNLRAGRIAQGDQYLFILALDGLIGRIARRGFGLMAQVRRDALLALTQLGASPSQALSQFFIAHAHVHVAVLPNRSSFSI